MPGRSACARCAARPASQPDVAQNMSAAGRFLRRTSVGYSFWCPGCAEAHSLRVGQSGWSFNDNVDAPTFQPSVLVTRRVPPPREPDDPPDRICHSFVTDGRVQFLGDCTHALAGQTVPLPEWPLSDWSDG